MSKKRFIPALIYGALLAAFTIYVLLDAFVIPRVYSEKVTVSSSETVMEETVTEEAVTDAAAGEEVSDKDVAEEGVTEEIASDEDTAKESVTAQISDPIITDSSYSDGNISIVISEYREYDTTIYVADVQVSSPEYLQTAFANGLYGKNVTAATSAIAEDNSAILAVNGDFYGSQEKGYVLRDGVLYRNVSAGREDLVIYNDGSFEIIDESQVSAEELLAKGAWQVLSFGPALLEDGSITVDENDEVGKAMASNPRTAIAVIDDLHYLFIVSDGRTDESEGLSLYQLAEFIRSLGADCAYNLDGGGSSTMYFNGRIVNNPTTNGRRVSERSVSDIIYIG